MTQTRYNIPVAKGTESGVPGQKAEQTGLLEKLEEALKSKDSAKQIIYQLKDHQTLIWIDKKDSGCPRIWCRNLIPGQPINPNAERTIVDFLNKKYGEDAAKDKVKDLYFYLHENIAKAEATKKGLNIFIVSDKPLESAYNLLEKTVASAEATLTKVVKVTSRWSFFNKPKTPTEASTQNQKIAEHHSNNPNAKK